MATAADYRKWAEECFEWARAASDDCVREQYAKIGHVWLEQAALAELLPPLRQSRRQRRKWPSPFLEIDLSEQLTVVVAHDEAFCSSTDHGGVLFDHLVGTNEHRRRAQ